MNDDIARFGDDMTLGQYSGRVGAYIDLEYPAIARLRDDDTAMSFDTVQRGTRIIFECFLTNQTPQMCASLLADVLRAAHGDVVE